MTTKCPQAIDILWKLNAIEVGVTIQEFESMKPFSIIPTGVRKLLTFSFSTYTYLNQILNQMQQVLGESIKKWKKPCSNSNFNSSNFSMVVLETCLHHTFFTYALSIEWIYTFFNKKN